MDLEIQQILTQIVAFLIMYAILKKFAWKPLLNMMDERKNLIQSEFNSIEEQKKEIHELNEAYQLKLKEIDKMAKNTLQEASNKGQQLVQEMEKETRQHIASLLNKAQVEMKTEREQAKDQLRTDMVKMVIAVTEKVIQTQMNETQHQRLIEDAIDLADFK